MLFAVERKGRSSQQRPSLLAGTTGAAAACSIIEVASRPGSSSSGVRRRPLDGRLRHSDGVDAQPLCLQQRKLLLTGGTAASCRVEMWRGGCRPNISVAASFVWRCLSGSTMTPFPHPAHRTGHADFPHPALGQDFTPSPTARRAQAGTGVRARSARRGARVDKSRPCVA